MLLAFLMTKKYRGHDGPLYLEKGPAKNPLFKAFFDAAVAAGFNRTDDVNGYSQEGFGPFDKNVKKVVAGLQLGLTYIQ